jgi:Peptidase A4 family
MSRSGIVSSACLVAACVAALLAGHSSGVAAVNGRAALSAHADTSSNWAGYVAMGFGSTASTASSAMNFTDVTGQWVQPKASCVVGTPTSVAIWVGLGGYSESSQELEQAGTSADCNADGLASYYIWYELVPADSINLKLKIAPGDTIASVVKISGSDVLVQVTDRTRNTRFTKHLQMASSDLTSAEWIVEAPSQCGPDGFCSQIPLTNFHSVVFTRSFAIGNNVPGAISSPTWTSTALQLVPRTSRFFGDPNQPATMGGAGAAPSALSQDGSGFTATWQPKPGSVGG